MESLVSGEVGRPGDPSIVAVTDFVLGNDSGEVSSMEPGLESWGHTHISTV